MNIMMGTYITDCIAKIKKASAALALLAIFTQTMAFAVSAQITRAPKADPKAGILIGDEKQGVNNAPVKSVEEKLSPDMQEDLDNPRRGVDEMQKVIIRLEPVTKLDELSGNVSRAQAADLFAAEVKSNRSKAAGLQQAMSDLRGSVKKSFDNVGLVSAELPLSQVKALAANADVAYISPDRDVQSSGHVMQTLGMYNSAVYVKSGTDYRDATGIGIAVIDSGMYTAHDLFKKGGAASRVTYSKDFTGENRTDDPYGHGTHVASLAAGDWYSNGGAYEAPASEANLINLRALKADGTGSSSYVVAALDWAIANKAAYNIRVINMSLGLSARDSYKNDPLCLAARRAFNAGIVVVASAGNTGKNSSGTKVYGSINSPGIEPTVLTVGAVDTKATDYRSDDNVASFSSKGPTRGYTSLLGIRKYDNIIKPDVVAPGNKLIGARAPGNKLVTTNASLKAGSETTTDNKKVMYLSGTSMAAPVVAGAAAVLLDTNPNLTPNMVKAILMYTAQRMHGYNTLEQGAGEINLDGAVQVAKLVKTTLPTSNGSALLNSALPSAQRSSIAGQTPYWSKSIVTNRVILTGDDLMNKYQGMYGAGLTMGDSVVMGDALLTTSLKKVANLTSGILSIGDGGVVMGDGVVISNGGGDGGVVMGDGIVFLNAILGGGDGGVVMGDAIVPGDGGVVMGDGIVVADSLLSVLNVLALDAQSGDGTMGMIAQDTVPAR